ncbi:MAG: type I polyketide synthase [Chloroflexi bacterium AL-W]|nr:type I polyketide synthase [Chloroflexi bacterium AL-N1]NOK71316.1 type I polyketide synthase [Chloroflexi bacterium AL-N10]NOK78662.1 type I polyketide synthase [Chloroflexi bacterium AL-N5]NOK85958.1 type I polyketide synthase [Chloroflexi bacterium AL-W]NOK93041.1 type I polyketide synthase [Chloroflexi bacterium AL-N15]
MQDTSTTYANDIAVIGMAGRFPGALDIDTFWENIKNGVESITFLTDDELRKAGVPQELLAIPEYVKARGVLSEADLFDASFFGYSAREAEIVDPQHRIFLETAWHALEHAGYDSQRYDGHISVYAGVGQGTYLLNNIMSNPSVIQTLGMMQVSHGNDKDFLATQVSYKLNLRGPSMAVQTACSTSLVAVHLACQSLLCGESDMAMAGGITIMFPQETGYPYQEGGVLSPDGHCRAFDAQARGTVAGSGIGIVVLKRLSDALDDGDYVHAVIKGSAINNDGSAKVGFTAPAVQGQAEVIAEAQAIAGVSPETITYIETHGTGTPLGDPIEVTALREVFRDGTDQKGFCGIGSVKTNIGHTDAAAGVAGLIKTVMALKHKQLPPSLHFETPNPEIDFDNSPFYVNTTLQEWNTNGSPRRAAVSSFGIGGTNAHMVLEEAPAVPESGDVGPWQILVLSAKTEVSLDGTTDRLVAYLKANPQCNIANVAYTLQVGRRVFKHCRFVVCQGVSDAIEALENRDPQRVVTYTQEPQRYSTVFMFSGQGSQYANMGRELYDHEPVFRDWVDRCAELLQPHLNLDLRTLLFPDDTADAVATDGVGARTKANNGTLDQTQYAQPALFVIEYALAQLWMAWGIQPEAMIGHSIGEYVAACLAEVFSLEDALALVAIRGKLMQALPAGEMLSVPLSEQELRPMLNANVSLAAVNAPNLCVVSGPFDAISALETELTQRGISGQRLHTSHAFHSAMMDPIVDTFTEQFEYIRLNPPQKPFISNVTGIWITEGEATDPEYWSTHLRQTVQFAMGMQELLQDSSRMFIEIGPGMTLSIFARRNEEGESPRLVLNSLRRPKEQTSDMMFLLTRAAQIYFAGMALDWLALHHNERRHRVPLPGYAFDRQRYWLEPQATFSSDNLQQMLLQPKADMAEWFYLPSWKLSLPPREPQTSDEEVQSLCWVVFSDDYGMGEALTQRLRAKNETVITVRAGTAFAHNLETQSFVINPELSNDYDTLFAALRKQETLPQRVLYLWDLASSDVATTQSAHAHIQNSGYYGLLFLGQALDKAFITTPVQLTVITNQLCQVSDADAILPDKAMVLGPCKTLAQEYQHITFRCIDIGLPKDDMVHSSALVDHLLSEAGHYTNESVIAYRGKQRWVQTYEPVRLDEERAPVRQFRSQGVYLITGGLGNLGLLLARSLAQNVQARLVLVGRSGLPEKESWEDWLATHEEADPTSARIRQVQQMEELGAEVLVMSADVASADQMRAVIEQTHERFGALHGVIHGAGQVSAFNFFRETNREISELQFQSKVYGTYVLDTILQPYDLDFCVLISSNAATLGGLAMTAYAAANSFLDAFATFKSTTSNVPWISTNWDGLQFETDTLQIQTSIDQYSLYGPEIFEAFSRIVTNGNTHQMVVSKGDLRTRVDMWVNKRSADLAAETDTGSETTNFYARPQLSSAYVAPRDEIEEAVTEIWERLLGVQPIGCFDNFFELGGHSLLATQIIAHVREAFQVDVPIRHLLENPTIADMAVAIVEHKALDIDEDVLAQLLDDLDDIDALSEEDGQKSLAQKH